jgi:hypothetical protein
VNADPPTAFSAAGTLRWPLPPLLAACGISARELARRIRASGHTVGIAARDGLTDVQADNWAIRLGLHPLDVWGWAWIERADDADGRPAHLRLATILRDQITRGHFTPGEQLPRVADLGERWQVSSKTVANALAQLRVEGLVVGGGRRGCANRVASDLTLPTGADHCSVCGVAVRPGDEHYPHRPSCTFAAQRWCDCDTTAHPECCGTCTEASA